MARIQPVLTPAELALVDPDGRLDGLEANGCDRERTDRLSLVRAAGADRAPGRGASQTGEEVALETSELAVLEGKGNRLGPEELGLLAKQLAAASDPIEAERLRERLTRGFYG